MQISSWADFEKTIGLYIHFPWCLKKCPYCDFHSYGIESQKIPEMEYITALCRDLIADLPHIQKRLILSVYIGGGTPSLISTQGLAKLFAVIHDKLSLAPEVEITIEANPGTIDLAKLKDLRSFGVNRLSLGIQSFQDTNLQILGRIYDSKTAIKAIDLAHKAEFDNLNFDIIYGLPEQTSENVLYDLYSALALNPTHLSWYQLNIEPGTEFYRAKLCLPNDDLVWQMEKEGREIIAAKGFKRYEISAYSKSDYECRHNLNYWLFGDYLGIGAGAHGKITDLNDRKITRYKKQEIPDLYFQASDSYIATEKILSSSELPFEFMLNALRLCRSLPVSLFSERTGMNKDAIIKTLSRAEKQGLVKYNEEYFVTTPLGKNFLNELLVMFI